MSVVSVGLTCATCGKRALFSLTGSVSDALTGYRCDACARGAAPARPLGLVFPKLPASGSDAAQKEAEMLEEFIEQCKATESALAQRMAAWAREHRHVTQKMRAALADIEQRSSGDSEDDYGGHFHADDYPTFH